MKLSRTARALLGLASGVLLALSFPNYHLPLLAWGAIALLILACVGASVADALLAGFLHGLAFHPVCLPWVYVVMRQYGNVDPLPAAGILGLIGVTGGFHMMIFTASVSFVSRRRASLAFVLAPFVWVATEFIRTHLPIISFPWNLSGYAASGNLGLLQITPLTGVFGLSLVVGAFNALLAWAIYTRTARAWKAVGAGAAALIVVAIVGPHLVPSQAPHFVAHLVQTNFPQSDHYPADWIDKHAGELDELESISVNAAQVKPGVVIWPETPAPFTFQDPKFRERAQRIARESGHYFLLGIVDWRLDAQHHWQATNSATLLDPAGQRVYTYDKIHLVPFGEYVPVREWITFAGRLTADIADFTPGTKYEIGQLPGGRFGTFICYEAIFGGEVREFAARGASLLVTISNDGWFRRSAAPEQHLMMARVRAVENRRWLLRDTNNGFTVSVDPYGRIVAELATDIRGQLDAPYDFRTDRTLYSICGDWIAWFALLASIGIVGGAAVRFPRRVAAKMSAAGKPSAVGKSGASSHHRKSKLQDRQR